MRMFLRSTVLLTLGLAALAAGQDTETPDPAMTKAASTSATSLTSLISPPSVAGAPSPSGASVTSVSGLADVKRIYVSQLTGGKGKEALRDLLIASISASHEFVITENEERADAIMKGAADDEVFTDHFDSNESTTVHGGIGLYGAAVKGAAGRGPGGYGTESAGEHESTRDQERKHEAYAAVRLCNKDGDVIWSTTQESLGAKFRGAGADVAARVARQLVLDLEKARRHEFETAAAPGLGGLAPSGPLGPPIRTSGAPSVPPRQTKQ